MKAMRRRLAALAIGALFYTGGNWGMNDYLSGAPWSTAAPTVAYAYTTLTPISPALPANPGTNAPYWFGQYTFSANGAATVTLSQTWLRQD